MVSITMYRNQFRYSEANVDLFALGISLPAKRAFGTEERNNNRGTRRGIELRSAVFAGGNLETLSQTYVQKRISQTQRSTQITSARQVVLPRRLSLREDRVTSWCSALLHRTASFFRTKSSFGSSWALFRRMEFRRTANIRQHKEYLGPLPRVSSSP